MPHFSEINEPSSSQVIDDCQYKLTESENDIILLSLYLQNTTVSVASSSLHNNQSTSSCTTYFSDNYPQTFVKTTYHLQLPYLRIIYIL